MTGPGEYQLDADACLEFGDGSECKGPVEYRPTLDASLKAWPRCDHHAAGYYRRMEENQEKYGGDCVPADFDPTYAGERWYEDE